MSALNIMNPMRIFFLLILLAVLPGCGTKGPLYMPAPASEATPVATPAPLTTPAPEPADTKKPDASSQ
jgi:predicted small lipoprotein YifL